ncbi:hypothetical protein [Streptomyces sp. NPDC051211]|uniref:hypothetical protein n=1 Tax=Streptomyces sp. NPDC051211 TaxID=3154643 RepID=UPI00345044BF
MQRGLVHALAWTLATGAAVTLSWWGVHTVMSGTAYDRPKAIPLAAGALSSSTAQAQPPAPPEPSASPTPSAAPFSAPAPAPSAKPPKKSPTASPGQRPPRQPDGRTTGPDGGSGTVKGYTVSGGRVVFDLGASSAELVSATPAGGWQMQVWKQPYWIRVTFTKDDREVSVFCTWNDHPPMVEIVDP